MKTPKFKIGDWVRTNWITLVDYDSKTGERKIFKSGLSETAIGQICGATRKMLGQYREGVDHLPGYSPNYVEEDYYPPHLEVKGSVVLWEIRRGYLNIPILALERDITRLKKKTKTPTLPWIKQVRIPWSEKQKEEQSRTMQVAPRGKKGRWL